MAAGDVLGRAYIEVHADTSPFNRELQTDLARATRSVTPRSKRQGSQLGQAMGRSVTTSMQQTIQRNSPGMWRQIGRVWSQQVRRGNVFRGIGTSLGQTVKISFLRVFSGGRLGRDIGMIFREEINSSRSTVVAGLRAYTRSLSRTVRPLFFGFGRDLGSAAARGAGHGAGGGGRGPGLLASLGASIGNVGSNGPLATPVGAGIIALIIGAIGAVAALTTLLKGLVQGLVAVPAAVSVAAAAIGTLVVGFQGLGDAIGAIKSGDPKEIAAAFAKLTPSARAFAEEIRKAMPIFSEMRKAAQESLFAPIAKDKSFTKTIQALGPIFTKGLATVGAAWGRFFRYFLELLRDPRQQQFFKNLFSTTATVIDKLGPGFIRMMQGFFDVANAAFPGIEKASEIIGGKMAEFGQWLSRISHDGRVQEFLHNFRLAMGVLWSILKAGGGVLSALFANVDMGQAEGFLDKLLGVLEVMERFFRSDIGREAINGMVNAAGLLVLAFLGAVLTIGLMIAAIQEFFSWIGRAVGRAWDLVDALGAAFQVGSAAGIITAEIAKNGITSKAAANLKRQLNQGAAAGEDIGKAVTTDDIKAILAQLAKGTAPKKHARGTITSGPEHALIGEAGPEAVIPLTDRNRARALLAQSGLDQLSKSGEGNVYVFIGNEQVDAHIERVNGRSQKRFARSMRSGPRAIGVVA